MIVPRHTAVSQTRSLLMASLTVVQSKNSPINSSLINCFRISDVPARVGAASHGISEISYVEENPETDQPVLVMHVSIPGREPTWHDEAIGGRATFFDGGGNEASLGWQNKIHCVISKT